MFDEVAEFYKSQKWNTADCLILTFSNKDATSFIRMVLKARGIHDLKKTFLTKIEPKNPVKCVTYKPVEKPTPLVIGINAPTLFAQDTFEETNNCKIQRGTIGEVSSYKYDEDEICTSSLKIKGYGRPLTFNRILSQQVDVAGASELLATFHFRNGIATTFNQAQGRKRVMIDTRSGKLYPAQFYTGASRVCNSEAIQFTYLPDDEMSSLESVIHPDKGAIDELKKWIANWPLVELPSDVTNFVQDDDKENTPKTE